MSKYRTLNNGEWQGSNNTALLVINQIVARWGDEAAKDYDPKTNCFTYLTWQSKGFQVKKGEKALKSYTIYRKQKLDDKGEPIKGEVISFKRPISLFYHLQVEPKN